MDVDQRRRAAYLFVLASGLGFSVSAAGFQAGGWHPAGNMAGRGLIAGLIFLLFYRNIPRRLTKLLAVAILIVAGQTAMFITSLQFTSGTIAMTLLYTCLMWTPIFARIRGETVPLRDWIVCGVIFGAIVLEFMDDPTAGKLLGNFLALGAGAGWGLSIVLLRNATKDERIQITTFNNLLLAVAGAVFIWLNDLTFVPPRPWIILGLGVAFAGAYVSLLKGFDSLRSSEVSVGVSALDASLGVLWVVTFSGERAGPFTQIGASIIIATVFVHGLLTVTEKNPPGEGGGDDGHSTTLEEVRP